MKKLMLVAAAAAMTNAFAITQVYDMRINLKTTECKSATLSANQNPFVPAGGMISYRDVTTVTIQGIIWACDCEYVLDLGMANYNAALTAAQIAGEDGLALAANLGGTIPPRAAGNNNLFRSYVWSDSTRYNPGAKQTAISGCEGYIFWNTRTGEPFGYAPITKTAGAGVNGWSIPHSGLPVIDPVPMPTFYWWFLQRIGMRAEKVEGTWEFVDWYSGNTKYDLVGSGFGQSTPSRTTGPTANLLAFNALPGAAVNGINECGEALITQMSGNVAGSAAGMSGNGGCVFCGVVACTAYPFCNCNLAIAPQVSPDSAAYGTWTLRYNATLSNRLLGFTSIRSCYNFPTAVDEMVQFLEYYAM